MEQSDLKKDLKKKKGAIIKENEVKSRLEEETTERIE